jgi:transcriptional regulator with XRE-family HTH domain
VSPNDTRCIRLESCDNVGAALQRVREQSGLTVEDLSHATKIAPPTIRAIERNQIDHIPRGIFLRGFLRAYASHVGLDVEETVSRYLAQFEEEPAPVPPPRDDAWGDEDDDRIALDGDTSTREAPMNRVVVVLAVALCAIGYVRLREPQPGIAAGRPAPVAEAARGAAFAPADIIGTSGASDVMPAVQSGVPLDIIATGPCWVAAYTRDGVAVLVELMQEGERRSLTVRDELLLRVGDPAAFTYRIDGVPGRTLGRPQQAVSVRITRENYREFITPAT